MALVVKDRVRETTNTTGTGTYTLAGAVTGFQSFSVIGNGNTTYYSVNDGTNWEVGLGTYTSSGTTLSRDTILESSNGGNAVNWGAGAKDIFVTYPAERAVYLNGGGTAVDDLDITTLDVTTANISTANITAGTVSTTPTSNTDLVNKLYVDNLVAAGIHFHTPVRVESPINLNATYNNGTAGVGATLTNAGTQTALVIDGVTVNVNDRVLVYQQTTQTQNGIYVVTNVGSGSTNWVLTRATDADSYVIDSPNGLSEGSTVFVQEGATGAGETYTCNTSGTITFGTTNITFVQISSAQIYSAGTGLTLSGTQFSLSNVGTAGTYGSASQVPVITTNAQGQVSSVTNTNIAIAGSAITSGTVAVANGGTGQSTYTDGQLLIGNTTGNTLTKATLTAGTGISVTNGNGSITVAATNNGTVTSVSGTGTVNGITLSGTVTSSGSLTLGGTLSGVNLSTQVTGTLPIANGGSGQTTAQAAMNAFAGAVTSGSYLRGNGTNVVMSTIQAADVPTLNQNTTGTAANATNVTLTTSTTASAFKVPFANTTVSTTGNYGLLQDSEATFTYNPSTNTLTVGTVSAALSGNATTATTLQTARTIQTDLASTSAASFNGSANITPGVTGTLPVANGGTGATTFTASAYLKGNGTSAIQAQTGIPAGDITSGTLAVARGGTGLASIAALSIPVANSANTYTTVTPAAGQSVRINAGGTAWEAYTPSAGGGSGTVTSVAFSTGTTGLSVTGSPITTSGTITLAGTLAIANGGTGQTTQQAALNALSGAVTSGRYLRGNGTNVSMSTLQAADMTGTLAIANGGTGATTASTALSNLGGYPSSNPNGYTSNTGTVTNVSGTGTVNGITLSGSVSSSGSLSLSGSISGVDLGSAITGTLPIGNGGTGGTATPTLYGLAYGTGSAYAFTAQGSSGQFLISNGSSSPPSWSSSISLSTFIASSDGTAAAPAFSFTSDTNTGLYRVTTDTIAITTAGSERMRWREDGRVYIGRTTDLLTSARLTVDATGQSTCIFGVQNSTNIFCVNRGTSSWEPISFRYNTSTQVGVITSTSTSTSYGTGSDYRLKDNVQPMTGALSKLAQLKPVIYTWKANNEHGEGFIAHELQEVAPYAVTGEKDAVEEDGSIKPQNVDYGKITPILTAALQEAVKKIELLEARIAALEAR